MKIKFTLSKPKGIIPKEYQHLLAGAFYSSLKRVSAENNHIYDDYHEKLNIHVISQLYGTKKVFDGNLMVNPNAQFLSWHIASPDNDMLLKVCSELWKKKSLILNDIKLLKFDILSPLDSENKHRFMVQSPVILKRTVDGEKHYYVVDDGNEEKDLTISGKKVRYHIHRNNKMCSEIMKDNILHKARILDVELDENLKIFFDDEYKNKKVRPVVVKKNIKAIASTCPVIVEANNQTINFISEVGLGHSTGMGFGYI